MPEQSPTDYLDQIEMQSLHDAMLDADRMSRVRKLVLARVREQAWDAWYTEHPPQAEEHATADERRGVDWTAVALAVASAAATWLMLAGVYQTAALLGWI